MADSLTQLQDCLDDLLTQMYAALSYIQTRHPYGDIPGQPSQAPEPAPEPAANSTTPVLTNGDAAHAPAVDSATTTPPPETADRFDEALHELARDLVLKEQQIEILINSLPGIGTSEAEQERRMREVEAELKQVERERAKAEQEKDRVVEILGQMIVGAKRVPPG